MIVRERHVADRWLFGEEDRICTSCGAILYTRPLVYQAKPSFVLVEQMDVERHPWGIPAGKVEPWEEDPDRTVMREVGEETGLVVPVENYRQLFSLSGRGNRIKLVYGALLPPGWMEQVAGRRWQYSQGIWVADYYQAEIGRVACVPASELFQRNHSILADYYRWDVLHYVKAYLESLAVI